MSQLVGSTAGAMLKVDNDGSGSALDLQVGDPAANPADKTTPPMTVDSQAEVANLRAQFAGTADDALHADTADSATSAQNATNAGNADTVDGKHAADFAAKAEAPGFDFHTVTDSTSLSPAIQNIATITVTAPADGFVILTGNGIFQANHTNGTGTSPSASLTNMSGVMEGNNLTFQGIPASAPSGTYWAPFSITRVFPVTAGEHTFYMTANVSSGGGEIIRHNLTGVFIKNRF